MSDVEGCSKLQSAAELKVQLRENISDSILKAEDGASAEVVDY